MPNLNRAIIDIYERLLRLYPARFRVEFADEMRDVFRLTVADANGGWSLLGLFAGELRDLPFSLLREYWRERRQKEMVWQEEGIAMRRNYFSPRVFRWCIIAIFMVVALYLCSATLAYFVFDLSHNDITKASEWWYDVGNQPSYIGNFIPLTLVGAFLWVCAPMLIVLAGGLLFIMLLRQWPILSRRLRWLGVAAILVGSAMFLSMGSPIGYMAALWAYD